MIIEVPHAIENVAVADPSENWPQSPVKDSSGTNSSCTAHPTETQICGDSSVVRAPVSWSKGCGFELWQENLFLHGQLSVLTLILVFVPQLVLHTCPTYTSIKYILKIIILGGYGPIGKWIQENIIFMRFCWCFKLSKKIEKCLNEQPTHSITKCTLTGRVQ